MSKASEQVSDFHAKFNFPANRTGRAAAPGDGLANFRVALLREEFNEYRYAVDDCDAVSVADALGDMLYVIYGTALTYGIDLDAVVDEIHRSNMTKSPSATGKAAKGPDYSPPNLAAVRSADRG